jgi:hypothetical protein
MGNPNLWKRHCFSEQDEMPPGLLAEGVSHSLGGNAGPALFILLFTLFALLFMLFNISRSSDIVRCRHQQNTRREADAAP